MVDQVGRGDGFAEGLIVRGRAGGLGRALELLLTGDRIDANEAYRIGLVNRVVPRRRLAAETRALAARIALLPPVTASLVKESINHTLDLMGKRDAFAYHFMLHQFMHGTETARKALKDRRRPGSIAAMVRERDRPFATRGRRRR